MGRVLFVWDGRGRLGATWVLRLWAVGYGPWALEERCAALCCSRSLCSLAGGAGMGEWTLSPVRHLSYGYGLWAMGRGL